MKPRVICIDDEPRVLKGLRRTLSRDFDVTVAESGAEALQIMHSSEPYHVVVSDMRMPAMNGAQLLATVRAEYPDSVRVLLTGQSDLQDAIAAVNDGNIFRFLSKPCPTEVLSKTLNDAVEHNRLIRSERELLDETVRGSVALLAEILSIRDPVAAARGLRLRDHVGALAKLLGVEHPWDYEVAATLSEIGYALVPNDIVDRWRGGAELTAKEQQVIDRQPQVARDLIAKIPRLEVVAEVLGAMAPGAPRSSDSRVRLAVDLIRASTIYDGYLRAGLKEGAAAQRVRASHTEVPEPILNGLEQLAVAAGGYTIKSLGVDDLVSGMRLAEDLFSADGRLLLTEGAEVTLAARTRIEQFADHVGIREPIKVRVAI